MRRIKLIVEYDGTDFSGWQRQDNSPSVQATIEDALAQMTGGLTRIRGAGRTDAGVHALGQVAHFDTEAHIPLHGFQRGLNTLLPRSISIRNVEEVTDDFDARFSAQGKLYRYQIWNSPSRSPLSDRFVWHVPQALDFGAMRAAAHLLQGQHEFDSFRASDCERKTTRRNLFRLAVVQPEAPQAEPLVWVEAEADAFLKNMVRVLVGTLVEVGKNRRDPESMTGLLAARDRRLAGITAPPHGLTLVRVHYAPGGKSRLKLAAAEGTVPLS